MSFDVNRFVNARWIPRTEDYIVTNPTILAYFDKDDKAIYKLRGLSGVELGACNLAATMEPERLALIEAIAARNLKEIQEHLKNTVGIGDLSPIDMSKRLEYMLKGLVDPEPSFDLCKTWLIAFPVEFIDITHIILKLTGQGHVSGE